MTIDFLHLYSRCPHCTTMFRAAVSDIDASEGWVKCGHCRKVFDCRKNEIKPADFVKIEESSEEQTDESESNEQELDDLTATDAKSPDEEEFVPQISLFDESSGLEKTDEDAVTQSAVDRSVQGRLAAKHENKSGSSVNPVMIEKSPAVEQIKDDSAVNPKLESSKLRMPAAPNKTLQASRPKLDTSGFNPTKSENKTQQQSILKNRLTITKPKAPGFSQIILAKAQSWKKQKNRFKKTKVFPFALIAVALFALLIWQIAIVNYTRLSQYSFLSAPLAAVCSVVTCNQTAEPSDHGFEILHASVRRHASIPNVMSVSAKLINFSDENKLMPTVRLDLTNDDKTVIASKIINLPENPQFVDPVLTELAPGQDVQLEFNIENPVKSAHGFQLNLVSNRE